MQTHTLNSRPSGRYSGNVAQALQNLRQADLAAFETADGILIHRFRTFIEPDGEGARVAVPSIIPIVAGRVDLAAVAAFIGH